MGWNLFNAAVLVYEIALLGFLIFSRIKQKNLGKPKFFLAFVFVNSLVLHFVPQLFDPARDVTVVLALMDSVGAAIKFFVGEANVGLVKTLASEYVLFNVAYVFGMAIAVSTTIIAAVAVFSNLRLNHRRLKKALRENECDIVIGCEETALEYANTCNAVLLLGKEVEKEKVAELIKAGYIVLHKNFSDELFSSKLFNDTTKYNFICFKDANVIQYIDTFIGFRKTLCNKHIHLYVELEGDIAETVRREIVMKNKEEAAITTFSVNELMARTFAEEHPVTRYLPTALIEKGAIKPETDIHIFLLGYSSFSKDLYRQLVLLNQYVTFEDGEYRSLPLHYHLCDTDIDTDTRLISKLKEDLEELKTSKEPYFPFPALPFDTQVHNKLPSARDVSTAIKNTVSSRNSFCFVIVDTDDDCYNFEIAAKLKTALHGHNNFRLFVRSEAAYAQSDDTVTYFGRKSTVLTHGIIVNNELDTIAKTLHEIYRSKNPNEKKWEDLDYFTQYSNIHAAMNLRVILNLLGLDYVKSGNGENVKLIAMRHQHRGDENYRFADYAEKSVRNALIAQEHTRWNAYHLAYGFLPMPKNAITEKERKNGKVKYNTSSAETRQHVCLTTHTGLAELSHHLAEKSGGATESYDYYRYDEMLVLTAGELLQKLGYSVEDKK